MLTVPELRLTVVTVVPAVDPYTRTTNKNVQRLNPIFPTKCLSPAHWAPRTALV